MDPKPLHLESECRALESEAGSRSVRSRDHSVRFFKRTQDIDDIAQETFLRAYSAEATQTVHAPKAFLFRVARNIALDVNAKSARARTESRLRRSVILTGRQES